MATAPTFSERLDALREQAAADLAPYVQYEGYHDGAEWTLVRFKRELSTKGGFSFAADQEAIGRPSIRGPLGSYVVYSPVRKIHVEVPRHYFVVVEQGA